MKATKEKKVGSSRQRTALKNSLVTLNESCCEKGYELRHVNFKVLSHEVTNGLRNSNLSQ